MSNLLEDFQPNDLLYGTTDDRKKYLPLLDAKFGQKDHTIDRLTRAYSLKTGFVKHWSKEELVKNSDRAAYLPEEAQAFYVFAQQSSFAGKLSGQGTSNTTKNRIQKGKDLTKPFLRSKCKAGIEFVISRGFRVRFVTDSLTPQVLSAIFKKEFEQPWYTGAELRYVKKNWDRLQDGVVFYRNGESCAPPWQ